MLPLPRLPERLSCFIVAQLYRSLPPPADKSPEGRETRDVVAMAAVRRYGPANTAEALVAVQAVAAQAYAADCLAAAGEHYDDFRKATQCRAQSAVMMRQMATALKELRILQEERFAVEARQEAEERARQRQEALEAEATADEMTDTPAHPATDPVAAEPGTDQAPAQDARAVRAETPPPGLSHVMRHSVTQIDSETIARLAAQVVVPPRPHVAAL